ncbi:MAG: hypothetical protein JSU70_04655 [Phycisphaerales bacterium]|nr:MAG: hypothetical protein JSU70_04655 [Phycisphaerales bacterium]
MCKLVITLLTVGTVLLAAPLTSLGKEQPSKVDKNDVARDEAKPAEWTSAVEPKPLSKNVKRGLRWLVKHQHPSGGWAQGEESPQMGNSLNHLKDKPNVADTCAAALALIRSGSTPSKGPYAKNILSAVKYVCSEVQESDANSLFVTEARGTRLQIKLGTYIDTFLASMLLPEVTGKMPDKHSEDMVTTAFNKVMDKIERNQRQDGTFGGTGWANALSLSMASKGINRAAQSGYQIDEQVRQRIESHAQGRYDNVSGKFSAMDSAGIELYASAAAVSAMQDSDNTNQTKKKGLEQKLANAQTQAERAEAQRTLERFQKNEENLKSAQDAVIDKLDDQRFIAGFGSNGGEEFLSYMNIGESLVVKAGPEWEKWDKKITANLNRIQNKDGSWTGHHCITGRTFCTSAALLVLMTDRAPVPIAAKFRR